MGIQRSQCGIDDVVERLLENCSILQYRQRKEELGGMATWMCQFLQSRWLLMV